MNDLIAKIYDELTKICVCSEFANISNYCDFLTYDLNDFRNMVKIVLDISCKTYEYDFTIKQRQFSDRYSLTIFSNWWTLEIEYLLPV